VQDHPSSDARLTVDEFLEWYQRLPKEAGRFELWDGRIVMKHGGAGSMNAEQAGHRRMKSRLFMALVASVEAAGLEAQVEPDGATVRLASGRSFEPDALVYLGPPVAETALVVPNPIIVCEVLSPSTRDFDLNEKRDAYFELPSVAHYLIGDPDGPELIHHWRGPRGGIARALHRSAATRIVLDPPGLTVQLDRIFGLL